MSPWIISKAILKGNLSTNYKKLASVFDGIILNAAAYTHTSVGIGDAVKAITTPVVEVHISNTFSRESFRHQSYISPNARALLSVSDSTATNSL